MIELNVNPEFQSLIPRLSDQELERLEANLLADGCRDPLVVSAGTLIDGHNRYAICTRHGLPFKTKEMQFESDLHTKLWITTNQLGRRNLTDDQRSIILDEAIEIESRLAMVERGKQGGRGHVKLLDDASDKFAKPKKDTRSRMSKAAKISERKLKKARAIRKKSPKIAAKVKAGELTLNEAAKEMRAAEIAQQRSAVAKAGAAVKPSDRWAVHHADMESWTTDKRFDFIITDPPYPKEFLPLYGTLARRANEWLKDGGMLVAMCGQSFLDDIYELMVKHLDYYWTAAYLTPGQPKPLRQVNVNSTWKPLLMFTKGKYAGKIFGDVFTSAGNDKEHHKWGQSESGMFDIVSKLVLPGQSVLDPFCGAGTTGVVALRHGCLFDGIELDMDNVNISKKRLAEV